jgi:hypothetical protein
MRCAGLDLIPPPECHLGGCSRYLHPGDAPRMGEWPRQDFRPLPGPYSPADMVGAACSRFGLSDPDRPPIVGAMFSVDEATAEAIRRVFNESGELSAAIELRRHFPGITDNAAARRCVRTIANWNPLPPLPPRRTRTCRTRSLTP